jgi:AraC-like DNA-binding protein
MKPALEAPAFESTGASLAAFVRREPVFDWNWHYHPEIELTWIRSGKGRRLVGDHTAEYGPGDLVLLGANLPHTWVSAPGSKRNEAIVVQFRAFPPELLRLPEFSAVEGLLRRAHTGLCFPRAGVVPAQLRKLARGRGLPAWLRLCQVLARLAANRSAQTLASSSYRHKRSHRMLSRIERVSDFVAANFRNEIPLANAARVAGLTPSAFSRMFRRATNQTYTSYRNAHRIREACRLLIETDLAITRIAGECGFDNLANFNRHFRERQKMTPRDYRRLHEPADA